jgi:hypothetical protein
MPRSLQKQYIYTPGSSSIGNVKIPGRQDLGELLLIHNVTKGETIYNFTDPNSNAVISFDVNDTASFGTDPLDGVSTIFLNKNTSTHSPNDDLRIYVEKEAVTFKPTNAGHDSVDRLKVVNPTSLIDADFEYGLQLTKWQTFGANRGIPSIFDVPGVDLGATSVSSSGNFPNSTVVVRTNTAHGLGIGNAVSIFGLLNDKAEGNFAVLSIPNSTTFTYEAKGQIPLGSLFTTYTNVRPAGFYAGTQLPLQSLTSNNSTPSVMTAVTANPHGLVPGAPIIIVDPTPGSQAYEGNFYVETVPNGTTFTYTAKGFTSTPVVAGIALFARNDSFYIHRPYDGGVILGTSIPVHGLEAKRQTKRYFRYQSGKSIMWSTGGLMAPNLDVNAVYWNSGSNTIEVVTDLEHGCQRGAGIILKGIEASGYNGYYRVQEPLSSRRFVISASLDNLPTEVTGALSIRPRISIRDYVGTRVQSGLMDDTNGLYWEYDGNQLFAVKRFSIFQAAGTVSANPNSFAITGSQTRFTQQCKVGDTITLRGMAYRVSSISSDTALTIVPEYRGVRPVGDLKMSLVQEQKIPQSEFNFDTLDGTGPSGYNLDINKMQMYGLQYSWYGAGYIDYMLKGVDGEWIVAHRIKNNNLNDESYMRSGNLPARYEISNYGPVSRLASAMDLSEDPIHVETIRDFPAASTEFPVIVMVTSTIDGVVYNELISYTGISGSYLTGISRPVAYQPFVDEEYKIFTGATPKEHPKNSSIIVYNCTCAPTLSHWGSSVIMDGGFDTDRSYQFNISRTNFSVPANSTRTILLFRLAPSVSNTIAGDLGDREVINRSELLLKKLEVTTARRCEIFGVLNPTNIADDIFTFLNSSQVQIGSTRTTQPSFSQYNFQFATPPQNGELLFRLTSPGDNQKVEINLETIKSMNNSVIGGRNTFPDGPDVLAICAQNLSTTSSTADVLLQWTEAQA